MTQRALTRLTELFEAAFLSCRLFDAGEMRKHQRAGLQRLAARRELVQRRLARLSA